MSTNSQSPISEKELRETYELLPKEKLIDALVNLHKELRTSRPEQPRELPTEEDAMNEAQRRYSNTVDLIPTNKRIFVAGYNWLRDKIKE
jgi:hypothetical protein